MGAARHLVSLRRPVPSGRRERYDALWEELRRRATGGGAHAWRFVAAEDPRLFLEFLEFAAPADPRAEPEVGDLLRRLDDEVGVAEVEEWREG